MKNTEDTIWVPVYRDIIETDYDPLEDIDHLPCVELLITKGKLMEWLRRENRSWDWFENESITGDFDDLYSFVKPDVIKMRYCS